MQTTFASDNFSGVLPEVMHYLQQINTGHQPSYGEDEYTQQATELLQQSFGGSIQVRYFTTGTAANIYALKILLTRPYESVLVPNTAHTQADEVGAPQSVIGTQLLTITTADGKLRLEDLQKEYTSRVELDYHSTLPKVVSIAQSTECGTMYTVQEIKDIANWCHANNMYLHMDGCRLPNAVVAQQSSLIDMTREAGVDVLCFGGAKNGLMNAEAVIIFNAPEQSLARAQKQILQLSSKMRYVSAQFVPYMSNDLWRKCASTANDLARQLAEGLMQIPGVKLTQELQTNQIFVSMPRKVIDGLHAAGHQFYDWDKTINEVRFVTAWDNSQKDIEQLLADAKVAIGSA